MLLTVPLALFGQVIANDRLGRKGMLLFRIVDIYPAKCLTLFMV